jgi:ATP-binding cassette subfamily C protein CydC
MMPLLRILSLWRGRAAWLLLGLVLSLAALLVALALMQQAGARIAGAWSGVAVAAALALRWLGLGRVVLRYLERLATHAATFRALADLRVWFFRGVATRAAGGLGFRRAGDVLSRLVNDVEALDGLYLRILVPLAGACLVVPVLVLAVGPGLFGAPGLAASVGIWLAVLIGALALLAALVLPALAARATTRAGGELAEAAGGLRVAALDTLGGLREVHAFGAQTRMQELVAAREETLITAQHAVARRAAWANAGAFLCAQAALLALLACAGVAPLPAIAAIFLAVAAFELLGGLPRAGALAGHANAAARRVLEAASGAEPYADPAQPAALPTGCALRFETVHFRWQADRPPVFDGLTMDIPEGSRVAILGPSGAGKSSLAALALKVVAPQAGRVLLGGVDIASLRAAEVRGRISWLSQTTHLFDDTIRANLLLGRPDATDPELWAALDQAAVGDLVRGLPDQLESWLGEAGHRVSGGQGRRLALARALLSPAPILLLDEPCAGLDAETERAFLTTLNQVAVGRTVILIAHRLTGAERLDRIWRINGGHAVAAAA